MTDLNVGLPDFDAATDQIPRFGPSLWRRLSMNNLGDPIGPHQQLTPNAATFLTVPALAVAAVLTVKGGNLRFTTDGTVPKGTLGDLVAPGSVITITGRASLKGFQMINVHPGGNVDVDYFG